MYSLGTGGTYEERRIWEPDSKQEHESGVLQEHRSEAIIQVWTIQGESGRSQRCKGNQSPIGHREQEIKGNEGLSRNVP